jgi:hypothetical protein
MLPRQAQVARPSKYAKALINYVRSKSLRQLTFDLDEQSWLLSFIFSSSQFVKLLFFLCVLNRRGSVNA